MPAFKELLKSVMPKVFSTNGESAVKQEVRQGAESNFVFRPSPNNGSMNNPQGVTLRGYSDGVILLKDQLGMPVVAVRQCVYRPGENYYDPNKAVVEVRRQEKIFVFGWEPKAGSRYTEIGIAPDERGEVEISPGVRFSSDFKELRGPLGKVVFRG